MPHLQIPIPFPHIPPQAGVVFDNASTSGYEAALSTYSWTHRTGTLYRGIIVVGVEIFATGTVTSVTYNSVNLTFLRADANGVYRTELWYLVNPTSGSNTVTVNLSVALTSIASAQTYWNVNQGSPIDANNGSNGTGTPASASVTTINAAARVVGALSTLTASGVTSAGAQAPRTSGTGALGTGDSDDKGLIDTPASTTLQWNGIGVGNSWAVSLVSLKVDTTPPFLQYFPVVDPLREWPQIVGY